MCGGARGGRRQDWTRKERTSKGGGGPGSRNGRPLGTPNQDVAGTFSGPGSPVLLTGRTLVVKGRDRGWATPSGWVGRDPLTGVDTDPAQGPVPVSPFKGVSFSRRSPINPHEPPLECHGPPHCDGLGWSQTPPPFTGSRERRPLTSRRSPVRTMSPLPCARPRGTSLIPWDRRR